MIFCSLQTLSFAYFPVQIEHWRSLLHLELCFKSCPQTRRQTKTNPVRPTDILEVR
ncbi:hypothetical protein BgiMline_009339, partial [Biomphalaria glabrata]